MLNMLFNTLLKLTPHNRQKKKKKRKNNVGTFTTIFAVGHPSSSLPRPTGLDLRSVTKKTSFVRVIARYVFPGTAQREGLGGL